jgi:hypothetical protein
MLTSLNQGCVVLEDDAFRDFIALLDGARTRADLGDELSSRLGQAVEDKQIAEMLAIAAKLAFLTA